MSAHAPVSLAARERLRDHQAAAAKAVAAHSAAMSRLDSAISRQAEIFAAQEAVVASARDEVAAAVAAVDRVMGVDIATTLLDLSKADVRRMLRAHRSGGEG